MTFTNDISKSEAIHLLKNYVLDDRGSQKMHSKNINIKNQIHYHFENLIKPKKLETRNICIDKKIYKNLVVYFTRYHTAKPITMLNLRYDKLIGKIDDYVGKNI